MLRAATLTLRRTAGGIVSGLSALALPGFFALAGGGAFAVLSPNDGHIQFLLLMVFGLWAACFLHFVGLLRFTAFFGFGFSIIINFRKTFGMPELASQALVYGEARFQFVSITDLCLGVIFLLFLLGQLPGEKPRASLFTRWTVYAAAAFWVLAGASYFVAPDKGRALGQIAFDMKLMAMALLLAFLFSDRKRVRDWLPAIIYGMVGACGLEFLLVAIEYTGVIRLGPGNFMGVPYGIGVQEQMLGGPGMTRVSGTYGHANYLGAALAVVSVVVWELLLARDSILTRHRNLFWAGWAGVSMALLLTMSRGAWVSLAAAVAIYFPFALRIQGQGWLASFLKRYGAVSVLSAVLMLVAFWGPLERRLFHSGTSAMDSRVRINNVSYSVLARDPYFGSGIGNHIALTETDPFMVSTRRAIPVPIPAHNIHLLLSTEIGIIGAFIYFMIPFSIFIMSLRGCLRHSADPLAPVCFAFGGSLIVYMIADCFSPVTRQINCAYMYWMLAGIASGTLSAMNGAAAAQAQTAQTGTQAVAVPEAEEVEAEEVVEVVEAIPFDPEAEEVAAEFIPEIADAEEVRFVRLPRTKEAG